MNATELVERTPTPMTDLIAVRSVWRRVRPWSKTEPVREGWDLRGERILITTVDEEWVNFLCVGSAGHGGTKISCLLDDYVEEMGEARVRVQKRERRRG